MQTPAAIVPEWYLLPFYAILRSIPNKLLGVIAMFSAILILLLLPIADLSRSRGMQFRPLSKVGFYVFIANFLILMQLGAKHVESPFIELGQWSTGLYFAYYILAMSKGTSTENSLVYLSFSSSSLQNRDEVYTNLYLNKSEESSMYLNLNNIYSDYNLSLKDPDEEKDPLWCGFKADLLICYFTVKDFIKKNYKAIAISFVVLSLILFIVG